MAAAGAILWASANLTLSTVTAQVPAPNFESAERAFSDERFVDAEQLFAGGVRDAEAHGHNTDVVEGLTGLGLVQSELGRFGAAAQSLSRAKEIADRTDISVQSRARAYWAFGDLQIRLGNFEAGREACAKAEELLWTAGQLSKHPIALIAMCLGDYIDEMRPPGDRPYNHRSTDAYAYAFEAAATDPRVTTLQRARMRMRQALAASRVPNDQFFEKRVQTIKDVRELCRTALGQQSYCAIESQVAWAGLLSQQKLWTQVYSELSSARDIAIAVMGPRHPYLGFLQILIGIAEVEDSYNLPGAATTLTEALDIAISSFGPIHPDAASAMYLRGDVELRLRRFTEAEADLDRAVAIRNKIYGEGHAATRQASDLLERARTLQKER